MFSIDYRYFKRDERTIPAWAYMFYRMKIPPFAYKMEPIEDEE